MTLRNIFRLPARMFLTGLVLASLAPFSSALALSCTTPLEALPQLDRAGANRFFNAATTTTFYDRWGANCAWSDQAAAVLLARISRAGEEGLAPEFFDVRNISLHTPKKNSTAAQERDLLLTDLALRYGHTMVFGQIDITKIETDIFLPFRKFDLTTSLATALGQGNISGWLQNLAPQDAAYGQLKDMLAHYRRLQKNGGWQILPQGPTLKPGESDPLLPDLRRRLIIEGDLGQSVDDPVFDEITVNAVKHFQARHGLTPDGLPGKKTRQMLNIPVEIWIDRIIANLDRWRYLGPSLPATRFEVNIAAGEAKLIHDGAVTLSMRAIVGKPSLPTPILLSTFSEVIVNPSWTVPASIVESEIPPRLRHDPRYLAHNRMRWIQGWLVQAPGPDNPLGQLKFNFFNPFSVYLHDTPARLLFEQDDRARSHGCIRLERPLDLAGYLLKENPEWPLERIEEATTQNKTIHIPLSERLPVAIVYWTAFVSEEGGYEMRDDIYGRDERFTQTLAQQLEMAEIP